MSDAAFHLVNTTLIQGHQVASGRSTTDKRFPEGTIAMQLPYFKERGFDLAAYFDHDFVLGTLNLSTGVHEVKIETPEIYFKDIKWTPIFHAENFYLSPAEVIHQDKRYRALLYIPDPATKPDHFQGSTMVEVIAQQISNIPYGASVDLVYNPKAIRLDPEPALPIKALPTTIPFDRLPRLAS